MEIDDQWRERATTYINIKNDFDELKILLADAKDELLALAGDEDASGYGVSVSHSTRKGTINYKVIVEKFLPDVGLEFYRNEPSNVIKVTTTKAEE